MPGLAASSAYFAPPLQGDDRQPDLGRGPSEPALSSGVLDASAQRLCRPAWLCVGSAMADYIMVDMVAEAASGQRTPEEAAKRAEQRANRYYRV